MKIQTKLVGERILIRKYEENDGESFLSLLQGNVDHLRPVVPEVEKVTSLNQAVSRNQGLIKDWKNGTRYVLPIICKNESTMVGEIWIEPVNKEKRIFEIGYFLAKNQVGKGLASEAVQLGLRLLFGDLNASKVEIHTDESNLKSRRVAERNGFTIAVPEKYDDYAGSTPRSYYALLEEGYKGHIN